MQEAKKYLLNGDWTLDFTLPEGEAVHTEAPVPGNVEPVLVKLGLLTDYMPPDRDDATTPFDVVDDWRYTTTFDAPKAAPGWSQELVFEGIDTIAEIYLNGEEVCRCNDMHLAYRIDLAGKVKETGNTLEVVIRSSELWARNHCHDVFSTSNGVPSFYDSRTYLRKARHQWGWDNAPRLLTSGIIRPVYIEEKPPARFEEVYLYTISVDSESVSVGVDWLYRTDAKSLLNHRIQMALLDGDEVVWEETRKVYFVQGEFRFGLPREKVKLWWPAGFGDPHLYTARLTMLVDGEETAVHQETFGIRTLRLERTDDILADGTGEFVFRVNGEKVFARGANWKPLDPLASQADVKTRTGKALEAAKDLNCNMIRIWGGGIYEDPYFFDYCDRNGIMVWQDFMFACEFPASDAWYAKLVAQEAQYIIKKQRNHPSLAVWCGDNEDDECTWWVNKGTTVHPSNNVINRKILKDAVLHFDPFRSYVESSPIVSDTNFDQRSSSEPMTHFTPETHLYPHPTKFGEALRECHSFFIGETGPFFVNAIAVNDSIFAREKERLARNWDADVPMGEGCHQDEGYVAMWRTVGRQMCLQAFGRDFTFAEWKDYTLAINLLMGALFKDVVEYCRTMRWTKTGVIWWSLMDMWPQMFNYSIMDYQYNPKLPYFWIRQSQQEFALMGVRKETGGELALYAVNDTLKAETVDYTVTVYTQKGEKGQLASGRCTQAPNSVSLIQRIAESEEPELWIIQWQRNGKTYTNHVVTKMPDFETARDWVRLIAEADGFASELLELR